MTFNPPLVTLVSVSGELDFEWSSFWSLEGVKAKTPGKRQLRGKRGVDGRGKDRREGCRTIGTGRRARGPCGLLWAVEEGGWRRRRKGNEIPGAGGGQRRAAEDGQGESAGCAAWAAPSAGRGCKNPFSYSLSSNYFISARG